MIIKERIIEYIEVPDFFNRKLVKSIILEDFLKEVQIIDNKIDIQYLRDYYVLNRLNALALIEELKLRGFKFILKSENNFLRNINSTEEYSEIKLIFTEKDEGKIQKVNRKIFTEFNYSLGEDTDFYFNLIPLYTFGEKSKLAEVEFSRYGYDILKVKDLNKEVDNIENYNIELEALVNNQPETMKNIVEYLNSINIHRVNDLKGFNYNKLLSLEGVGESRLEDFKSLVTEGYYKKDIDKVNIEEVEYTFKYGWISEYINILKKDYEFFKFLLSRQKIENIIKARTSTEERLLEFLKAQDINNLYDFLKFDIYKIRDVKGVGDKLYSDIKTSAIKDVELFYKEVREFNLNSIPYRIKNRNFKRLYQELFMEELDDSYDIKLSEINFKDEDIDFDYRYRVLVLMLKLDELVNINKLLSDNRVKNLSDRDKKIIYSRIYEDKTLKEIGDEFELSRERVRQIVDNFIRIFNKKIKYTDLVSSLKINYGYNYFNLDNLKIDLKDENYYLIWLIKDGAVDGIFYEEALNRVYFEDISKKKGFSNIEETIKNIPEIGRIDETFYSIKYIFEHYFGKLSNEEYYEVLEQFGINIIGNIYYIGTLDNKSILDYLFREEFKEPFRIEDSSKHKIEDAIEKNFKLKEEKVARNWEGILYRVNNIYLVGPRTFIHKEHIPITNKSKLELEGILKEEFKKNKIISIKRLFGEIRDSSIDEFISEHHLYSYIKDVYEEKVEPSSGNTMDITLKGNEDMTNEQILYRLCKENEGYLEYNLAKKNIGWSKKRLDSTLFNSPHLIKAGDSILIIDDVLTEKTSNAFKNIIEDEMREGYSSATKIFRRALFDEELNRFLNKYNIKTASAIVPIIKFLDSRILGHTVFLYYDKQDITSIEDYIYSLDKEFIYREEIDKILEEFGFSDVQLGITIDRMLSSKRFIQIETNKYIKYEYFNIDSNLLDRITNILESDISKYGYIIPENYVDRIIYEVGYHEKFIWNQHILKEILENKGYRKLKRYGVSYSLEIIVMVKEDSKYNSISELVYDMLKYDYEGNMHEVSIYEYLSDIGIYPRETIDSKKYLQNDIKENNLIKVDLSKRVRLK